VLEGAPMGSTDGFDGCDDGCEDNGRSDGEADGLTWYVITTDPSPMDGAVL
jgi:hypothetical protein